MQKIDIDGIIKKTYTEISRDSGLKKEYNDIGNKPKTKIRELKYKEFMKFIFFNFFIKNGKFNEVFMKIDSLYIEYKKNKITEKGYLGKFYEGTNIFVKTIKITFIKNFIEEVKFCPYCGKNALTYFGNIDEFFNDEVDNRRTFELDHFFPKDTFYNIGFNLYNLIPSCKPCNHLKSNRNPFDKIEFYHPYFGWIKDKKVVENCIFDNKLTFNEKNDLLKREYIYTNSHSDLFSLKQIYNNSQDTKNDIWFIRDKIEKIKTNKHGSKILGIKKNFNTRERIDIFFKNYYPENEQDILKYSNGKLKKDLIENLKL